MLIKELLKLLACPVCKGQLTWMEEKEKLFCKNCCLCYPVREKVPVLIAEKASRIID